MILRDQKNPFPGQLATLHPMHQGELEKGSVPLSSQVSAKTHAFGLLSWNKSKPTG